MAARVFFDERFFARFLDPVRDFVDRLLPRNVFPVIGSRTAHLRFQETARVQDVLFKGGALRAKRAAIDGMIRIALDVDHLWRYVLGFIADRINQDATTHRAVWAG